MCIACTLSVLTTVANALEAAPEVGGTRILARFFALAPLSDEDRTEAATKLLAELKPVELLNLDSTLDMLGVYMQGISEGVQVRLRQIKHHAKDIGGKPILDGEGRDTGIRMMEGSEALSFLMSLARNQH